MFVAEACARDTSGQFGWISIANPSIECDYRLGSSCDTLAKPERKKQESLELSECANCFVLLFQYIWIGIGIV